MPKDKDPALVDRNRMIREMRDEGRTMQAIADSVGLSKARISQILEELDEEVSIGGYRAFLASQVELGLMEMVKILRKDAPVKVSAGGKVMYYPDPDDPSGRTPDFDSPIYDDAVKIDAAKALSPLVDRLSKLRGADAQRQRDEVDESEVSAEVAYIQKLISDRKMLTDKLLEHGEIVELTPYEGFYEAEVVPSESPEDSAELSLRSRSGDVQASQTARSETFRTLTSRHRRACGRNSPPHP